MLEYFFQKEKYEKGKVGKKESRKKKQEKGCCEKNDAQHKAGRSIIKKRKHETNAPGNKKLNVCIVAVQRKNDEGFKVNDPAGLFSHLLFHISTPAYLLF